MVLSGSQLWYFPCCQLIYIPHVLWHCVILVLKNIVKLKSKNTYTDCYAQVLWRFSSCAAILGSQHCTALKMTRLWYLYHSSCSYWFVHAIISEDKHHNAEDSINLIKEQTQLLSALHDYSILAVVKKMAITATLSLQKKCHQKRRQGETGGRYQDCIREAAGKSCSLSSKVEIFGHLFGSGVVHFSTVFLKVVNGCLASLVPLVQVSATMTPMYFMHVCLTGPSMTPIHLMHFCLTGPTMTPMYLMHVCLTGPTMAPVYFTHF